MKLRKKSGLTLGIIALSAAAITSVGFAAWVISQGDSADVVGNILVDTVDDQRHTISEAKLVTALNSTTDATNANVIYGTSSNADSGWLKNTDTDYAENLDFYLYVKVDNVNASNTIASVMESVVVTSTGGGTVLTDKTGYAGAATTSFGKADASGTGKSLVGALPIPSTTQTNFTADGEVWYSISFQWGTLTGGDNPYDYYNDGVKTAAVYGDEAKESLDFLHTLLTGASYTITVTTAA